MIMPVASGFGCGAFEVSVEFERFAGEAVVYDKFRDSADRRGVGGGG
jgi:hypothetical protein